MCLSSVSYFPLPSITLLKYSQKEKKFSFFTKYFNIAIVLLRTTVIFFFPCQLSKFHPHRTYRVMKLKLCAIFFYFLHYGRVKMGAERKKITSELSLE